MTIGFLRPVILRLRRSNNKLSKPSLTNLETFSDAQKKFGYLLPLLTNDTIFSIKLTVSKAYKTLEKMKANPRDWRIEQLEVLADQFEIEVRRAKAGRSSHHVFVHKPTGQRLTIPAHRPIKPVYVRRLAAMIVNVIEGE